MGIKMKNISLLVATLFLFACSTTTLWKNYDPKKDNTKTFNKDYGECVLQTNNSYDLRQACLMAKGWYKADN